MSISTSMFGPHSKHDKTLPYTYVARVATVRTDIDIFDDCFADTICGLIEYLEENDIPPEDVELYGVYRNQHLPLDKKYCMAPDGTWLKRPELCRVLEAHYRESLEEQYRGHAEKSACSFEDRDREGLGPF